MNQARGFSNVELINRSLRELISKITPARILKFADTFDPTQPENERAEDPVIQVQKIARRLANHYKIIVSAIIVTFRSNLEVPGRVELTPASEFFIELHDNHRHDAAARLAILAHEVAHIFLYRAGIELEPTFLNEVLTDTTAVFLGCGPAILNGASQTTTRNGDVVSTRVVKYGYLSVDEYGYILAKRDAYLNLGSTKFVNDGLPQWGYDCGRQRLRSEMSKAPFTRPNIFRRMLRACRPRQDAEVVPDRKITLECLCCAQGLRIPALGKRMVVRCSTCQTRIQCYT